MAMLVNLGSLCIDSVYSVPNLAKAGETVASLGSATFPGGKGLNQSIAASLAGAKVMHFGAVGEDGDLLLDALTGAGVDVTGVLQLPGPSGHAVIQVDPAGQNAIVISGGANRALTQAVFDAALGAMGDDDWLLLQNEINDLDSVIRQAHSRGRRIALNLAPADARIGGYPLELVDLLIVNEIEGMAAAGSSTVDEAFERLVEKYPDASIVLTEGRDGLRFSEPGGEAGRLGAYAVDAVDETAAGDAFVGYLMAGLVNGAVLRATLVEASAAGALTVTQMGAGSAIPDRAIVLDLVAQNPL